MDEQTDERTEPDGQIDVEVEIVIWIYPKIKLIVPKTQLSGPGAYVVTVLTILQQLMQATLLVGNCVKYGCHSSGVFGGS